MLLSKKASAAPFNTNPFQNYWKELKTRALRTLYVAILAFIVGSIAYNHIWALILGQIRFICPDLKIVSRSVLGPASLTVALAATISLVIGILWGMAEIWCFIYPALLPKERQIWRFLGLSFLVLAGALQYICFFQAFPLLLAVLLHFNQNIVEASVDLADLLGFALSLHKGLLVIALWPYFLVGLVYQGWISQKLLKDSRRYVYVGAFIIGMILTPPDVISQCVLAIPLILLYEGALIGVSIAAKY